MTQNRDKKFLREERDVAGNVVEVYQDAYGRTHRVTIREEPDFFMRQAETAKAKARYYGDLAELVEARSKLKIALAQEEDVDRVILGRALPSPKQPRALPPRIIDDVEYTEDGE